MIFTCNSCQRSFKTPDEKNTILPISRLVVPKPTPNPDKFADLPESERAAAIAEFQQVLLDEQKIILEDTTPRNFGEMVGVVDENDIRAVVVYHDLEPAQITEKEDGITQYGCPQCSQIICEVKKP